MKHIIKIIYVLLLFAGSKKGLAQASTWIITNPGTTSSKGILNASLVADNIENQGQIAAITKLKRQEDKYHEATKFDKTILLTMAATKASIEDTHRVVVDLERKINQLKTRKLFFGKQGVKKLESDLKKEKNYLDQIRSDSNYIFAGGIFGGFTSYSAGGSGYYYTATIKLMLRNTKIRRNILDIKMAIDNKITNNNIFKK